jgi:hypothetical protein
MLDQGNIINNILDLVKIRIIVYTIISNGVAHSDNPKPGSYLLQNGDGHRQKLRIEPPDTRRIKC